MSRAGRNSSGCRRIHRASGNLHGAQCARSFRADLVTADLISGDQPPVRSALATEAAVQTTQRAHGTFQVKVTPVSGGDNGAASGRMSLAKTFEGDLTGTSTGDMWTAGTAVSGSAGYVAIEKFE